jgi:hypothetical protein
MPKCALYHSPACQKSCPRSFHLLVLCPKALKHFKVNTVNILLTCASSCIGSLSPLIGPMISSSLSYACASLRHPLRKFQLEHCDV